MKTFLKVLPYIVIGILLVLNIRSCDNQTDVIYSNPEVQVIHDSIVQVKEKIVIQKEEIVVYRTIVKDHEVYRDSFITVYENDPTLANCDTALQVSVAHADTLQNLVLELDSLVIEQDVVIMLHDLKDDEQDKAYKKLRRKKNFWKITSGVRAGIAGGLAVLK